MVGRRLKGARVVRTRNAVTAVSATVENCLKLQTCKPAVLPYAELRMHQHRVASPVTVEHLFPRQCDLHRSSAFHREFGDCNFVAERIALTSEPTTVWACDHL